MNFRNIRKLAAVGLLQGTNFLLPALALPFLIRYLGPADYGVYNLAQIWAIYFSVIIAYGFDLSGTKDFASSDMSTDLWSRIYSKIFFSKLLLFTISAVVFVVIILCVSSMRQYAWTFLAMFLWTLNTLFFPSAFFLGLEKQSLVSFYSIISRVGSFLLILLLIYLKASRISLVLAYSVPQAAIAMIFHFYALKKYNISLKGIALSEIWKSLRESFVLFLSTVAGTITISVSVILLGILATEEIVGYFSVSSKLVSLLYGIVLFPFQIVFFPVIIKKVKKSYSEGAAFFIKLLILSFALMSTCCLTIFFLAGMVVNVFVGEAFGPAVSSLRVVCFVPLFALIDMLIGLFLVAIDRRAAYTGIVMIGMTVCIALNAILIPRFGEMGASWAWLIAEMSCFVCFVSVFAKDYFSRLSVTAATRKGKGRSII